MQIFLVLIVCRHPSAMEMNEILFVVLTLKNDIF